MFRSSFQIDTRLSTHMVAPSGYVEIPATAAGAHSVLFSGDAEPEDRPRSLRRMNRFIHKFWELGDDFRDEISSNFAVRVESTEVRCHAVGVDAMPTIGADENHVLDINDIWRVLEMRVINDRVLVWNDAQLVFV